MHVSSAEGGNERNLGILVLSGIITSHYLVADINLMLHFIHLSILTQ